jgi:DNA-binding MarR family transcriptional regulator
LFEVAALHWSAGEALTVREMIDQSDLGSPATLHKRLQRLIAQDFLKAEVEASDRRTKYILPTTKGLKYAHWLGDKLLKSTMAIQSSP